MPISSPKFSRREKVNIEKQITDKKELSEILKACPRGIYPRWSRRFPGLLYLRSDGVLYYFALETFEKASKARINSMINSDEELRKRWRVRFREHMVEHTKRVQREGLR